MNRFLPAFVCVLCLLLGLSVGWYFGYTRPVVKNQRETLNEYRRVRNAFQVTDGEMADMGGRLPEFWDAAQRQDEYAAAMALAALVKLEEGDTNKARERLAGTIGIYYHTWHDNGADTNVIRNIEKYAGKYPLLSNAIWAGRGEKTR